MKGGGHSKYTAPLSNKGASNYCYNFRIDTIIQNIEPIPWAKVKVNDILPVKIRISKIVEIFNLSDEVCGVVISPRNKELIQCINSGNSYIAIVKSKSGNVLIEIQK